MKKIYLIIVVGMVMIGCGKEKTETRDLKVHVDSELEQYALEFEQEMGVNTDYISMMFGDLSGLQMGLCTSWSDGRREITIDKEYWDEQDDLGKEQLMYHELGHCAMNLSHDASLVLDPNTNQNIEASIMNPYFFGDDYNWHSYRDAYKQALKTTRRISF